MNNNKDFSFQSTKRQDRILPKDSFGDWKWREGLAELMVPIVGNFYRDGINILIYGKSLVNQSPVERGFSVALCHYPPNNLQQY